ncbi:MAG: hypothetical protein M3442_10330 [Chloroflexota bacterium]|nr:hypothetical protein [Chloroflexota bacterium]
MTDKGVANGTSGLSAAEGAAAEMAVAGRVNATNSSQTTAGSGAAAAIGVNAQNAVTNSSQAAVLVNGANQAPVSVVSSNKVVIQDTGTADVTSGSALGKGGAANLSAGAVITPLATATGGIVNPTATANPVATGPQSQASTATGLTSTNTLADAQTNAIAVPAGAGAAGTPVSVAINQTADVTAGGWSTANSAPTCAGAPCAGATPAGTAAPVAAGTAAGAAAGPAGVTVTNETVAQSSSGAAQAQGLKAQNAVTTNGSANVHVGGNNYGVIQVVIDTVTRIVNWGRAVAGSGDATATGGAATTDLQSGAGAPMAGAANGTDMNAASGNADATGARVSNQVDLRNSTTVRVAGDNYSPIDVVVRLAVNLYNWGSGRASSGDSQATGQAANASGAGGGTANRSGTSATSGAANATGLDVQNVVNLGADVYVDVAGNNYGNITLRLIFDTTIHNRGEADASSGRTTANGANATTKGGGGGAGPAAGDAPVVIRSSSTSGQLQNQGAVTAGAVGGADSNAQGTTGGTAVLKATSGSLKTSTSNSSETTAQSGNGTGVGVNSNVSSANSQVVGVAAPGSSDPRATNASSLKVNTDGRANIRSGDAMSQATPTPTPTPAPVFNAQGNTPSFVPPVDPPKVVPVPTWQPDPTLDPNGNTQTLTGSIWGPVRLGGEEALWNTPGQKLPVRARQPMGGYFEVDPWSALPDPDGLAMPGGGRRSSAGDTAGGQPRDRATGMALVPAGTAPGGPARPDGTGTGSTLVDEAPAAIADDTAEETAATPEETSVTKTSTINTLQAPTRSSAGGGAPWWWPIAAILSSVIALIAAGKRRREWLGAMLTRSFMRARVGLAALASLVLMHQGWWKR